MPNKLSREDKIDKKIKETSSEIGKFILQKQKEQGFSLSSIAEKANISNSFLYAVIDGQRIPSENYREKIANALNLIGKERNEFLKLCAKLEKDKQESKKRASALNAIDKRIETSRSECGKFILREQKKQGFILSNIARKIKISDANMTKIAEGYVIPSKDIQRKLAEEMNLSEADSKKFFAIADNDLKNRKEKAIHSYPSSALNAIDERIKASKTEIGKFILKEQKEQGFSLRSFAKKNGISESYMVSIAEGRVIPSKEIHEKIANGLNLSEEKRNKFLALASESKEEKETKKAKEEKQVKKKENIKNNVSHANHYQATYTHINTSEPINTTNLQPTNTDESEPVLKNFLGYETWEDLDEFTDIVTKDYTSILRYNEVNGNVSITDSKVDFTLKTFLTIHQDIYGDVFPDWAGQVRDANIIKNPNSKTNIETFAPPNSICPEFDRVYSKIRDNNFFVTMPMSQKIENLAEVMTDLYHISPCMAYNETPIAQYTKSLALVAGVRLKDLSELTPTDLALINTVAYYEMNNPKAKYGETWEKILNTMATPVEFKQQLSYINCLSSDFRSEVKSAFLNAQNKEKTQNQKSDYKQELKNSVNNKLKLNKLLSEFKNKGLSTSQRTHILTNEKITL